MFCTFTGVTSFTSQTFVNVTNICTRLFLHKNNKIYFIKAGLKFWFQVPFSLSEGYGLSEGKVK